MSIVDKLVSIETAKESIKSAITEKGVDLTGVSFIDYGGKISEISGGGGSGDYLEALNDVLNSTTYTSMTATVVPSFAFNYMSQLTSVNLPACTTVGMYAFNNCTSLTSVNLPACTKVYNAAFSYCMSLTSIDLPVCTSIGNSAFIGCWSLTSVSLPVCTSIGESAFYNCSELTSVNLPVCKTLGDSAFYKCLSLTSIDLPVCTSIGGYTFFSCMSLTSVSLPACTSVGMYAFRYCNKLTSVNFLPNCKNIDYYAFQCCYALTSVNIPVCTKLESMVFQYCSALTTVYLSGVSSVTYLYNSNAFSGCPALTSIYVPMSLVDAFKSATNWTYFSDKIVGWEGLVTREEIKYIPLKGTYLAGHQSTSIQIDANFDLSINLGETGRAYDDYVTICNGSLSTSALSGYDIKKAEIYCDTDSGITINNVYNSSYFADGVLTIEYGEYSHNSIVSISVGKDPINVNSIKIFYIK